MNINGNILMNKTLENGQVLTEKAKNTLTKLFENIIMSTAIGGLVSSNSAAEQGVSLAYTPFRKVSADSGQGMESAVSNDMFTIYLLNLTAAQQQLLSTDIKMNPILSNSLAIDDNALVGYATCSYGGTGAKQGNLSLIDGQVVTDFSKYGIAWHWNVGVLNGTFNTIILGTNIMENKLTNAYVSRGVDSNNKLLNEQETEGYYLCPGVTVVEGTGATVYTANNEILLGNGASKNKARRVLNLLTGEYTELAQSDARYDAPLFNYPHSVASGANIVIDKFDSIKRIAYPNTSETTISSSTQGFCFDRTNHLVYVKYMSGATSNPVFKAYDYANNFTGVPANDITPTFNYTAFNKALLYAMRLSHYGTGFYKLGNFVFDDLSAPDASVAFIVNSMFGQGYEFSETEGTDVIKHRVYISTYYGYDALTASGTNNISNTHTSNINRDKGFTIGGSNTYFGRTGIKIIETGNSGVTQNYEGQVFTYSILNNPVSVSSTESLDITYHFSI